MEEVKTRRYKSATWGTRPRARSGCNSYRNLVSSCIECNSQKGEKPADDFLRRLYREGHLNAAEFAARLRALDDLASGELRPLCITRKQK